MHRRLSQSFSAQTSWIGLPFSGKATSHITSHRPRFQLATPRNTGAISESLAPPTDIPMLLNQELGKRLVFGALHSLFLSIKGS